MRSVVRVVLGPLAVLAVAGFVVWRALLPPAPLAIPERGAVLKDVTVINPGAGRRAAATVRVEGTRIADVGPTLPTARSEYAGRFVLPGLIDMHVHFPPDTGLRSEELFAFLFLYHGVTTIRDAADVDGTATEPARRGVREGRIPGPRNFACGPLVDGNAPRWPNTVQVLEPADAEAAVTRVADAGYECVKVYNSLSPEALTAINEAAHARGLTTIGHVPIRVRILQSGIDDVQHMIGLGIEFGDTRPFPDLLDRWADFDEEEMESAAHAIAALGQAHTPTMVTRNRLAATRDPAIADEPDARLLPRMYREVIWGRETSPMIRQLTPERYAILDMQGPKARRMLWHMHRAGVRLFTGTDTLIPFVVPGASLHRELRLFVEAGLTPEEAWVAATRAPGEFLWLEGLGTIAPGAPADLLVFREDPTRDLDALDTLEAVVADGRLYTREQLDAQLARYQEHAESWLFDRISVTLARRAMQRVFDED